MHHHGQLPVMRVGLLLLLLCNFGACEPQGRPCEGDGCFCLTDDDCVVGCVPWAENAESCQADTCCESGWPVARGYEEAYMDRWNDVCGTGVCSPACREDRDCLSIGRYSAYCELGRCSATFVPAE